MEQEIKLAIDDTSRLTCLRNRHWFQCLFPSAGQNIIQMHSCYLDTPDGRLSEQHISLRLRRENEAMILTVKSGGYVSGYIHQRHEWSADWSGVWPPQSLDLSDILQVFADHHPQALEDTAWPLRQPADEASVLIVTCEVQFTRLAACFAWQNLQAEAALDQGWLIAGEKREALHELEIEYRSGDVRRLDDLADKLVKACGLRFEPESKLSRCLALLDKEAITDGGS